MNRTKFLLDSGDPDEYREISNLAKRVGAELWGATTNPTLIAKKLARTERSRSAGQKFTMAEAFDLQKKIVLEILEIVPGAVSVEVYADKITPASEMIEQGRDIATWHERVVVKLPTTIEGFKARTKLRQKGIATNNTLVFSQEQIFTICLHEKLVQKESGSQHSWPPFISPFVGRLDAIGLDGMTLVENGMKLKADVGVDLWMLEASVRTLQHVKRGIEIGTEIITGPAKVYREWFGLSEEERNTLDSESYTKDLKPLELWQPTDEIKEISTIAGFMEALSSGKLNIQHDLSDKGLDQFTADWQAIISS